MFEKFLMLFTIFFAYTIPIWLGLIAIWIYQRTLGRNSRSKDFISGLIFLYSFREFMRNFKVSRKRR